MLKPKFIFDECIGLPFYKSIIPVLKMHTIQCEFDHVCLAFKPGVKDINWIDAISKDWTIITSDNGKKSKQGEKLPLICMQKNISTILLSPSIHRKKQFQKAQAIIGLWEAILETKASSKGSQFRIKSNGDNRSPSLEFIKKNNK